MNDDIPVLILGFLLGFWACIGFVAWFEFWDRRMQRTGRK